MECVIFIDPTKIARQGNQAIVMPIEFGGMVATETAAPLKMSDQEMKP